MQRLDSVTQNKGCSSSCCCTHVRSPISSMTSSSSGTRSSSDLFLKIRLKIEGKKKKKNDDSNVNFNVQYNNVSASPLQKKETNKEYARNNKSNPKQRIVPGSE